MKLSLIIPVYNKAIYLPTCLKSILEQPYKDFELILVDDGSKDESLSVCHNYERTYKNIKVFKKPNGGASSARNFGLGKAEGDYIMFCDADDRWSEEIDLQRMINILEKNESLDFILFNMSLWDQQTGHLTPNPKFPKEATSSQLDKLAKMNALLSKAILPMSPCDKIIRKAFLINNNIRFIEGTTCEDYPWVFSLMEHAENFLCINKWNYHYRQDVAGAATKSKFAIDNYVLVTMIAADYYSQSRFDEASKIILNYLAGQYVSSIIHMNKSIRADSNNIYNYGWLLRYNKLTKVKAYNCLSTLVGESLTIKLFRLFLRIR